VTEAVRSDRKRKGHKHAGGTAAGSGGRSSTGPRIAGTKRAKQDSQPQQCVDHLPHIFARVKGLSAKFPALAQLHGQGLGRPPDNQARSSTDAIGNG
jgi:hypothetical protein